MRFHQEVSYLDTQDISNLRQDKKPLHQTNSRTPFELCLFLSNIELTL
jgi:hypothetical protein